MRVPKTLALIALMIAFSPMTSQAAKLASLCYSLDDSQPDVTVRGEKADQRLPIASVSKIMTAWWALTSKGPDYRFETKFHVNVVSNDTVDVHIEGARDPYFSKESLHLALSELSKMGIKKIGHFTFDENFKFFWDVTSSNVAVGDYVLESPKPETVLRQLRLKGSMLSGYETTQQQAKERGVEMVRNPDIRIESVEFKPMAEYQETSTTQTRVMSSAPLVALVKEMNRNSNNHAANQIFEHMGGAKAFHAFVQDRLKLSDSDIRFVNGSGDRLDIDGVGYYNEASCSAVIAVLQDFRETLQSYKMDLKNVMAVAGVDTTSTTHKLYNNDVTSHALVGKTGTVSPDVTLAGIAYTNDGDLYFMINMATKKGSKSEWRKARALIRNEITKLVSSHDGGKEIKMKGVQFFSFDRESIFANDDVNEFMGNEVLP